MTENVKHVEFAKYATYIAKYASAWAGDCLILPEYLERPMTDDALKRFCDNIQGYLRIINRQAP